MRVDYDGCEVLVVNGRVTKRVTYHGPGMAPRLPGYDCGCVREGSREEGWTVTYCAKHRRSTRPPRCTMRLA